MIFQRKTRLVVPYCRRSGVDSCQRPQGASFHRKACEPPGRHMPPPASAFPPTQGFTLCYGSRYPYFIVCKPFHRTLPAADKHQLAPVAGGGMLHTVVCGEHRGRPRPRQTCPTCPTCPSCPTRRHLCPVEQRVLRCTPNHRLRRGTLTRILGDLGIMTGILGALRALGVLRALG